MKTVLKFVAVSFDAKWDGPRASSPETSGWWYESKAGGTIQVVAEAPAGTLTTYTFTFPLPLGVPNGPPPTAVVVYIRENAIYIPGQCSSQVPGNAISCK